MIRIQFNNSNSMYPVNFKTISPGIVELTGKKVPRNTSGFKAHRLNGDFLGDYSDYTEIVGEVENGLQFGKKEGHDG